MTISLNWGDKLTVIQKNILKIIENDKSISIVALAKRNKLGTTAIENNLSKLKKAGIIKRVGPARGGHWVIVQKYDLIHIAVCS